MKRWLGFAAVMMLGTGSAVAAAPCPVSAGFPAYGFDENSFTSAFDLFAATLSSSASCSFSFVARPTTPQPDTFAVYSAEYRGSLFDDDRARITVKHNKRTSSWVLNADPSGNVVLDDLVGKEADGRIKSTVKLELLHATDPSSSQVTFDSVDYVEVAHMPKAAAVHSLNSLGRDQVGLVTHLDATAELLAGGGFSLEGPNEIGVLGGVGSFMFGGHARYNIASGYSVLGGLSIVDQSPGAQYSGLIGAAAIRYVQPDSSGFRLFGEGGVQAGGLTLSLSRSYTDSTGPQIATGIGSAGVGELYAKGGAVMEVNEANQLLFSASIKESFLGFGAYQEKVSSANYFAADLSGKTQSFTTAKAGLDWTTQFAPSLTLTSSLAVGTTIANDGAKAYIFGGGDIAGTAQSSLFADYGTRLDWALTPQSSVDGYIQGSTGTGIGTHVQIGAGAHWQF